ncbi:FGGY-family carbohydrate kinase [Roseicyclus amphidinii]|jgi:sugar (pentulose or hexulose) kinase|uniref:FGGY-family carbohydrate kinase n=1 Tax=Roseicyclus amphidinii TaxID=3034232 RepID=UPI0024E116EA|nr:FGGY-family carbohydrate kinase [Roseicyclus sp. Amp-Y-6]
MTQGHIAVIDIGKTNAKLALVRMSDLAEIAVVTRPNTVVPGPPYPHFDVEGHWSFLLDGLGRFHARHGVSAITVTTHGAAAALIAEEGTLAAPILDYEHAGPDRVRDAYDAIRPPFRETGSPRLAMGLNLGAQLHWQFHRDPGLRDRVWRVVTYPQFWAHRLTGVVATDVTSLGCHTDLWNPFSGTFSTLPDALGIADRIAPPRKPGDVLGTILPEIAARTGLAPDTPVFCGIHDSNASLLPHLMTLHAPFSVVSTGTWVIAMAVGGAPVTLDPERDTLVNVNALGQAVASARFMGGREHDLALGAARTEPDAAQIREVLTGRIMLFPALVPETGPYAGAKAAWSGPEPAQGSGQRSAAVGFYLALVTARCLELIGHQGIIVVEGPFARNRPYLWMLAEATASPVRAMTSATGTSQGAALLATADAPGDQDIPTLPAPDPETRGLLSSYARAWQRHVAAR